MKTELQDWFEVLPVFSQTAESLPLGESVLVKLLLNVRVTAVSVMTRYL